MMPSLPATVLLIRHAEKLDWFMGLEPSALTAQSYVDNHLLSAKGFERAHALRAYFTERPEMRAIFETTPLGAVFYQDVDEDKDGKGKSFRPKQTIEPLVELLNSDPKTEVPVFGFKKGQVCEMVSRLDGAEFKGKTVLVSWSHQQLPALAVALGCKRNVVPEKWGRRFDVTWVLSPIADGRCLTQLPQRLLYGDTDEAISVKEGFLGPDL